MMATTYIGIDPGLDGAMAVLFGLPDSRPIIFDTPTLVIGRNGKNKREYNLREMATRFRPYTFAPVLVYIEQVHSMPGQGVRSMFSMGYGVGAWEGLLAGFNFSYTRVHPQRWKKVMLDGMGHDKDAGRLRAMQLFPGIADQLARKKDDGRADALLIAEYGRRLHV